ncbi:MAG: hypothetical protein Q8R01_06420 [Ramlibacter sp.]|nr:hypothetical protein [Ramlibacter sp.]
MLRNLNVFIAAFVLGVAVGGWVLMVPTSLVLKLFIEPRRAEIVALPASYVVLAAILAWHWWRTGLSPKVRRPEREGSFRKGHALLLVSNLLAVGGPASSFLLPALLVHTKLPTLASAIMAAYPLSMIAGIAGLIMVWSARPAADAAAPADADAFADTVAQGPAAIARWPARPAKKKEKASVASALPAVLGMGASALLTFIFLVFASLGFQGRTKMFTGTVLPIAGVCFVFYVTTVIWLLGTARRSAATALAWSPVLLGVIGLPALQVIAMAVAVLLGK